MVADHAENEDGLGVVEQLDALRRRRRAGRSWLVEQSLAERRRAGRERGDCAQAHGSHVGAQSAEEHDGHQINHHHGLLQTASKERRHRISKEGAKAEIDDSRSDWSADGIDEHGGNDECGEQHHKLRLRRVQARVGQYGVRVVLAGGGVVFACERVSNDGDDFAERVAANLFGRRRKGLRRWRRRRSRRRWRRWRRRWRRRR